MQSNLQWQETDQRLLRDREWGEACLEIFGHNSHMDSAVQQLYDTATATSLLLSFSGRTLSHHMYSFQILVSSFYSHAQLMTLGFISLRK